MVLHHTPHALRAPLTSIEINRALAELDAALSTIILAGSSTSTTLTAEALAGQKNMVAAARDGFVVGDPFWIGSSGGTFEAGVIASGTGAGAGTLVAVANLASTYPIGTPISKSSPEIVNARGGQASLGARLSLFDRWAYDVRRYGAVCDGTTNDLAAIHAARDAAAAAGGGTIYLSGRCKVTAAVTLNVANVGMAGDGPETGLVTTGDHTVVAVTALGVELRDFKIEMPVGGNVVARTGIHFSAGAGLGCAARRLDITGGCRSILGQTCGYVVVEDCRITTFTHDGIEVGGSCSFWQVVRNHLYSGCTNIPAGTEQGAAISLNTSTDNLVADNLIRDNGTASPNGGGGIILNQSHRNRIHGNQCVGNGKAGLDLNGQGILLCGVGGSQYNSVVGNYCANNTAEGITLFEQGTSFNTVTGNVCRQNQKSGIEVWGAEFNSVVGNICDSSVAGVGIMLNKTGLPVGAHWCSVVGNICRNNWSNGIQCTDSAQVTLQGNQCIDNNRGNSALSYEGSGIALTGDSAACLISGNNCRDTAPVTKLQLYGLDIENTSSAIGGDNNFSGNKNGEVLNRHLMSGQQDGYIAMPETSDPGAGAANVGRLYMRDNGAGKTQLVAVFPTGAVQVIATQP